MPLRIANPIYREVVVRVLERTAEQNLPDLRGRYTLPDGRLDMGALLTDLLDFWRQHGELLAEGLVQVDEYLSRLGLQDGTLALFDRRPGAEPLPERARIEAARTPGDREIRVLRG